MLIAITQRNDTNAHGDRIDSLENNYPMLFQSMDAHVVRWNGLSYPAETISTPDFGDSRPVPRHRFRTCGMPRKKKRWKSP